MLNTNIFLKLNEITFSSEKDFVAKIPAGIKERQELFKALQDKLRLPDYFGYNWDALSECLEDFSWIPPQRIILIHEDIPPLEAKVLEVYLDILRLSVEFWETKQQHKLLVVFP